jgi:hypothetical protein
LVNADEWSSALPKKESDLQTSSVRIGLGLGQRTSASRHQLSRVAPLSEPRSYLLLPFSINLHGSQTISTMASAPRKTPASSQAEVALLPSLKNCLLNLPTSLVNVLLNSNAVVQNVVVELSFKSATGSDGKPGKQQSVFLGWTGMRSQTRRSGPRQEQEVAGVEIDATFGRLLGLKDGMKVRYLNR